MEFKIAKRKEFPLLNRERLNIEVNFPGVSTPKKESLKSGVASFLKVDGNLMAIRHVYNKFGEHKANIIVNLYKDADTLARFEKKKEKRVKKEKAAAK